MQEKAKLTNSLEAILWKEVRNSVTKVNPELAAIIDEIDPDEEHTLYRARYTYGSQLVDQGELYLPNSKHNTLTPFKSSKVSKRIQEDLGYNHGSNPAALVLSNSLELFLELEDRIIPYAIIPEGKIFGLWNALDQSQSFCPQTFLWGLTAGARSIFMLPKISDEAGNSKLRVEFNISSDRPKDLLHQWHIFREIAQSPQANSNWNVELLFFSKKWLSHREDPRWLKFNYYALNSAWQSSGYWRNQYIWGLVFSLIQKKRAIKPSAFLAAIVKHLLAMGCGSAPGFQPALDDTLAPISLIQKAYIDVYNLKTYAPIIMQPATFNMYEQTPASIYYSLQYPTAVEFAPKSSDKTSTLTDLYCTQSLLKKYLEEIEGGHFNVEETPLYDLTSKVNYNFFHSNTGNYRDIQKTQDIPKEDSIFKEYCKKFNGREFPRNCNFLNGCVGISHREDEEK